MSYFNDHLLYDSIVIKGVERGSRWGRIGIDEQLFKNCLYYKMLIVQFCGTAGVFTNPYILLSYIFYCNNGTLKLAYQQFVWNAWKHTSVRDSWKVE